ncbi:PucR family transcriptional regulator [Micrococcus luteus]|uniref:PucR family transcriptional regulator n=1 Tax=Micrococcus luteus TaxID=1270 RepID=UPI0033D37193
MLTHPLPSLAWQQDALTRRVRDRGFTGLAMPQADRLDAGTRRLAARLSLTILQVDRPVALAKTCWQLLQARDALSLVYVRRAASSFEYEAHDLGDLLRHLASNLKHGVALINAAEVIHQAGAELPPQLHERIDFASWLHEAAWVDHRAASVRIPNVPGEQLRLVMYGQGLDDTQIRALAAAAEVAMPAVAARRMVDEVTALNDANASAELLRDFLDLRGADDPEVERQMAERGWRHSGYHLGFRLSGRQRLDARDLLHTAARTLAATGQKANLAPSAGGVTGWLSFPDHPSPTQLEEAVGALRTLHREVRASRDIATGVGSCRNGRAGLTESLREAEDAARIAVNRDSNGWFVRVDALGLEQLLLAWAANDTFLPAAESLLAPLREDPRLLDTLACYLDQESTVQATADVMGLHRNTIAGRIQRIDELLGADMTDPDSRLALHLACRALRTGDPPR